MHIHIYIYTCMDPLGYGPFFSRTSCTPHRPQPKFGNPLRSVVVCHNAHLSYLKDFHGFWALMSLGFRAWGMVLGCNLSSRFGQGLGFRV